MSTIAVSRRTDTAVLIHTGELRAARHLREALAARGLYCADVRVDVGGALPAPDAAACAVIVDAPEVSEHLDPRVAGWLHRADAAGVAIYEVASDEAEPASQPRFGAFIDQALAAA